MCRDLALVKHKIRDDPRERIKEAEKAIKDIDEAIKDAYDPMVNCPLAAPIPAARPHLLPPRPCLRLGLC